MKSTNVSKILIYHMSLLACSCDTVKSFSRAMYKMNQ